LKNKNTHNYLGIFCYVVDDCFGTWDERHIFYNNCLKTVIEDMENYQKSQMNEYQKWSPSLLDWKTLSE
jgi:hypothetical protein